MNTTMTTRKSPHVAALVACAVFGVYAFSGPATCATAQIKHSPSAKSATAASKAQATAAKSDVAGIPADAQRIFNAVVKVHTRAVPDARSSTTLGQDREGSGIVIGNNGLILTIGYLIVEADDVKVTDNRGRTIPARVIASDQSTGLALLRALAPLDAAPIPFGDSANAKDREPVMVINNSGLDDVTLAYIVSRRAFTGNWEYMLDQAIFTSPPTLNWSGAALIDHNGKLLGVGSLIVRDALNSSQTLPGNMFVPIDELKPILADLLQNGRRPGPPRPWLGISADEQQGRLFVTRVSPDSPGEAAGIQTGDIILAVGEEGVRSQAEFYQKVWSRGPAGTEIPLRILQGIEIKDVSVHSMDRVDYFKPNTTF